MACENIFFCETHEICLVRWRHKRPLSRLKNGYAIQKMLDKLYAKYTRQDVDSHKQALIYMFHDSVCPSAYCSSEPFFKGMLEWAEEFLYQRFGKCLSCKTWPATLLCGWRLSCWTVIPWPMLMQIRNHYNLNYLISISFWSGRHTDTNCAMF